ncbi:radical SAM peptide maturase [uncultured Mediterranea sp.]|uniref:radical SAM peptide maturase n=1 Tax=uncultured Mediterranea sp. TaxID=1926662 RepID=UPI0027D9BD84|nr:radical SAM peptide maturase [uncultured Mediterranea sp.]
MKPATTLIPTKDHRYVYSDQLRYFLFVPPELERIIKEGTVPADADDYYARKFQFLKEARFFEETHTGFQTEYPAERIKQNIACLRQLLIEVTDRCNLRCKYCGYGELYFNYDKRDTRNQSFANVKVLIDELARLWQSDYNVSYQNTVAIGFYGGEPLLNMRLIRETIAYLESLCLKNLKFRFNMTTNAVLLDRYMDYLVEKDFFLLISLDGDEYQNSYRTDRKGRSSFPKVRDNILKLKNTYPDFFEKNVHFNAVLHDRNSVEGCLNYIHETFGKAPRISELNTNGIAPEKLEEFRKMFNSRYDGFRKVLEEQPEIKEKFEMEDAASIEYHSVIMNYGGNRYKTYVDLFEPVAEKKIIPTGTCRPFERKLFLTVNGKILPCERIGQEHVLGWVKDGTVQLDYEAVGRYYSSLYQKIIRNCIHCQLKRSCGQCLLLLKEKDGKLTCPYIQTDERLRATFSAFLSYAEKNPGDYERLLSSIIVS